uniref:ShKT domain-containing protein n=1 Tax=Romanomermis culicivorax TaxID=13658 RepID=A0A915HGS0_ROMCU
MESLALKLMCLSAMAASVAPDDPPIFLDQGLSPGAPGCSDVEPKCSVWASQGECQTNAAWMMSNCRRSCQSCQGGERAWQLRLTIAAHYDNTSGIRNYSINHVKLNSFHVDHIEMDEQKQTAKLHGKLVFTWNDSRVAWDKQRWGVSWLNFYWVQIWTPQVVQSNSPPSTPAQISSKVLAANYTGQVYMWADFSMTTLCDMDYGNYPYDVQKCTFKLDDRRYYAVRFTVAQSAIEEAKISARKVHAAGWKTQSVELNQNKYSVNVLADWSLDPFNVETSNVDALLILKRDHSYYGAEIVGPLVVPAVVTLVSFLAGSFWNQIALLLVSLLFQLLVSVTVNGQLPPASGEVPAICK